MDTRQNSLIIASVGALLGAVLIALFQYFRPAIDRFAADDPQTAATIAITGMFAFIVIPVAGMAIYFWRTGRTALRVCAVALLVTCLGISYVLWRLAQMI